MVFWKRLDLSMSLEEALGLVAPKKPELPQTSQNVTKFNVSELADIEQIKVYLEEHLTEEQIAKKLGCARETVSRKIAKWMPTEDFREWLSSRWLSQYNKFSSDGDLQVEAFKQLTRLLCVSTVRRQEIKAEIKEKVLVATVDLTKLSDNDRNAILRAEEALTRAETAAGS
jgi:hypothetical protein